LSNIAVGSPPEENQRSFETQCFKNSILNRRKRSETVCNMVGGAGIEPATTAV